MGSHISVPPSYFEKHNGDIPNPASLPSMAADQDVVVNDIMKNKDKDADDYLSPQEFQAQRFG